MVDPRYSNALLEIISILRAHIANCTLIENASVRDRNLTRLAALESALIALHGPDGEPTKADAP